MGWGAAQAADANPSQSRGRAAARRPPLAALHHPETGQQRMYCSSHSKQPWRLRPVTREYALHWQQRHILRRNIRSGVPRHPLDCHLLRWHRARAVPKFALFLTSPPLTPEPQPSAKAMHRSPLASATSPQHISVERTARTGSRFPAPAWRSAHRDFAAQEWKACQLLCGSSPGQALLRSYRTLRAPQTDQTPGAPVRALRRSAPAQSRAWPKLPSLLLPCLPVGEAAGAARLP